MVVAVNLPVRNRGGTETTLSELLNVGLETILDLGSFVARAELENDTGHALGDALELARGLLAVSGLDTLVDGLEGLEVEE